MFSRAMAFALKWEGGDKITRDPIDPGGTTKYGISQRAYPHLDIESLTYEQAAEIYERDYWRKGRCDQLPDPANLAHFDACVNCGVVQAAKFLQRALGVKDDGVIGVKTLAAVVNADPKEIAREAIVQREKYYHNLVSRKPALSRFINGWLNRTSDLKTECL